MPADDHQAGLLPSKQLVRIDAFWRGFSATADDFDAMFSGGGKVLNVATIIRARLDPVSDALMGEFGASDRGHALTITADWHDHLRPLARAVIARAPHLPGWRFRDARESVPVEQIAGPLEQRLKRPLAITKLDARVGASRVIDLVVAGDASKDVLHQQAMLLFSLIMGEADDQIWLGYIDASPRKKRFGVFAPKAHRLDLAEAARRIEAAVARARDLRPHEPLAGQDTSGCEVFMFASPTPDRGPAPRDDLILLASSYSEMNLAQLQGGRFASDRFSRFGETVVIVKISRAAGRFDDVADRHALETAVHVALGAAGSVTGRADGTGHLYLDIAPVAAWIIFAEPGLDDQARGVWPGSPAYRRLQ